MSRKRETDRNERVQYINRQVAVVIQLLLQLGRVMLYAHAIESKRQKRQATNIKNGTVHFATSFCKVKSPNLGRPLIWDTSHFLPALRCSSAVFIRCAERPLPPLLTQVSTSQHRLLSSSTRS